MRRLFGLAREEKVERLDVPGSGYQPITFEETAGVPPQGGTGTILRVAEQMPAKSLWPAGLREGFAVPVTRHLVLGLPFFLHVHNILDEAEAHMRAGEAVDLDEIALLLGARVRENLVVVYQPAAEGR